MTQAQMLDLITKALQAGPNMGKGYLKPKQTKAQMLSNKDKAIRSAFTKRGVKDVVLLDRTDPTKDFNVRPYGKVNEDGSKSGWLGQGRRVRKGEKAVRGLFHESQTEVDEA